MRASLAAARSAANANCTRGVSRRHVSLSTRLEDGRGACPQLGELLQQPVAVLEEARLVALVEALPVSRRVPPELLCSHTTAVGLSLNMNTCCTSKCANEAYANVLLACRPHVQPLGTPVEACKALASQCNAQCSAARISVAKLAIGCSWTGRYLLVASGQQLISVQRTGKVRR